MKSDTRPLILFFHVCFVLSFIPPLFLAIQTNFSSWLLRMKVFFSLHQSLQCFTQGASAGIWWQLLHFSLFPPPTPLSPHEFTHTCRSAHGTPMRSSAPLAVWWRGCWKGGWWWSSRSSGFDPAQMTMMVMEIRQTPCSCRVNYRSSLEKDGGRLAGWTGKRQPSFREQITRSITVHVSPPPPHPTSSQATPPLSPVQPVPRCLY